MQKYSDYAPTGFDAKGLLLPSKQNWLVMPCGQNRDSGCLDQSNFETATTMLGGEGENVEIHRFGHWACGWFEIIIVRPDTPQAEIAENIDCALADYPVLDDSDFSEREWNAATECWQSFSLSERVRECARYGISIFAARHESIPEDDSGGLFQMLVE